MCATKRYKNTIVFKVQELRIKEYKSTRIKQKLIQQKNAGAS